MDPNRVPQRIQGYDLARGIAVFGMFLMNFKLVMQGPDQEASGFWPGLLTACEGRFGVLFIVLAGIGVSLMTRRARETRDRVLMNRVRKTLVRRAGFLFVVGLLYIPLWEADILHYYGIYMAMAGGFFLFVSNRVLVACMGIFTLGFPVLALLFNWETGWDFHTLSYQGLWTAAGFIRHSFFNGFHPVFPWFAFFLFGMAVGRKNLAVPRIRERYLVKSLVVFGAVEFLSTVLVIAAGDPELAGLFHTLAFPPVPLFVVSGCASSLAVVLLCIWAAEKLPRALVHPLVCTGQMVLTHYVAHVLIAMAALEAMGKLYNQPLSFAVGFSCLYFTCSILFSTAWQARFAKGPLETVMRRISG